MKKYYSIIILGLMMFFFVQCGDMQCNPVVDPDNPDVPTEQDTTITETPGPIERWRLKPSPKGLLSWASDAVRSNASVEFPGGGALKLLFNDVGDANSEIKLGYFATDASGLEREVPLLSQRESNAPGNIIALEAMLMDCDGDPNSDLVVLYWSNNAKLMLKIMKGTGGNEVVTIPTENFHPAAEDGLYHLEIVPGKVISYKNAEGEMPKEFPIP